MKQFYSHYTNWEDFKNGMYCGSLDNDEDLIQKAKSLLSDPKEFYEVARKVIIEWPIATKVNLTNLGINRRAWIGQASCSFKYNVPEILTRAAWVELNDIQRFNANSVAEKIILHYERKDFEVHKDMGRQLLFQWNPR